MPEECVNWYADDEICLKDYHLSELPDSPTCPSLLKFFLQAPRLIAIPPTFFAHMPLLQVLDLSKSNIISLPTSLFSLSLLQEFYLRDSCQLIHLPTHIGMLTNLKLFDMFGTNLMFIPKEMGNLKELEVLRLSLPRGAKAYIKHMNVTQTVVPRKMISQLKRLKELCISVHPEAEWWEEEVKDIQSELCDLENLQTLRWCLPTSEALRLFLLLERNQFPAYLSLSSLMLTVGQYPQNNMSRLPLGLEKKFDEFENCLKWLDGEGALDDISKTMTTAEALFLSCHWTIEKLSALNLTKLKYCLLEDCNEMETLVEAPEDVIKNGGLESLQYLSVHHLYKLRSIWKGGPIGEDGLSKLKVLALHTCPQLTLIFTPAMARNLSCLTELTVEECPKVRSLISTESCNVECGPLFPSLKRIFLIDLPQLDRIFGCGIVLEELSTLLICGCLKLRSLDTNELPHMKRIEGEIEWWEDLDCDKSVWQNIYVPLTDETCWMKRLAEATNSLQHFRDIVSHESDEKKSSNLTDMREQVITAGTSTEKGKGVFLPSEGLDAEEEFSNMIGGLEVEQTMDPNVEQVMDGSITTMAQRQILCGSGQEMHFPAWERPSYA